MSQRGIPKPKIVTTNISNQGPSGIRSRTDVTQLTTCTSKSKIARPRPAQSGAASTSAAPCQGPCNEASKPAAPVPRGRPAGGPSRLLPPGFAQKPADSETPPRQIPSRIPSAPPRNTLPPGMAPRPRLQMLRGPASSTPLPGQNIGGIPGRPVPAHVITKGEPKKQVTRGLEETIHEKLLVESSSKPDSKVQATGRARTQTCRPEVIDTPDGPQQVLQKAVVEERVERTEKGERVVKNVAISDFDEESKFVETVQFGVQRFDPKHARIEGTEVVGVTSTVSVTETYKTISKECTRVTTESKITMSPAEVAQLVEEEKEDVENTLKMVPADLNLEPGRYEMKQRLQKLRLHSESMALLEQSIIHPEPTADEAQAEPSPEAMATMMHTVEKGISPQSDPDQVFNSLFKETANDQFVKVSSISPGPLQDVVAPTEIHRDIHKEMISENMAKLSEKLNARAAAEDVPAVDIFTKVMDDMKKSPQKGKNKAKSYQPIADEKSLWVNANMENLVNVIGAEPADVLDPYNLDELLEAGTLEEEMTNGIDYFIEANPVQYMSRVQLRGTQYPDYFPGYTIALPDFPGLVQLARSPDEVYASAWKAVQPKYFADETMHSIYF